MLFILTPFLGIIVTGEGGAVVVMTATAEKLDLAYHVIATEL